MKELKYDSEETPDEMLNQDQFQRESFNRITQDIINSHNNLGIKIPEIDKTTKGLLLYYHDLAFYAGLLVGLDRNKKE